jgi:hypothetical protein
MEAFFKEVMAWRMKGKSPNTAQFKQRRPKTRPAFLEVRGRPT